MPRRRFSRFALLPLGVMAAAPAHAVTLQEALHHWTGLAPQVSGAPPRVAIALPSVSPATRVTATALAGTRRGDPGWNLTEITLPEPLLLASGASLSIGRQENEAWLGHEVGEAEAHDTGIEVARKGSVTEVARADVSVHSDGGPVLLSAVLSGIRLAHGKPGAGALLPSRIAVDGHTTQQGAAALSQMLDREPSYGATVTIDRADWNVGPASFSAHGTVTIQNPDERHGRLVITATGFSDLMNSLPSEGAALRALPVLLAMRELGDRSGDAIRWTVDFDGPRVLIRGIDIAALAAL